MALTGTQQVSQIDHRHGSILLCSSQKFISNRNKTMPLTELHSTLSGYNFSHIRVVNAHFTSPLVYLHWQSPTSCQVNCYESESVREMRHILTLSVFFKKEASWPFKIWQVTYIKFQRSAREDSAESPIPDLKGQTRKVKRSQRMKRVAACSDSLKESLFSSTGHFLCR